MSLKLSLIVTLQILVQIVPLEFSFLPMIFCDHLAFSKCRLNSSRIANQGRLFLSILVLELSQERDSHLKFVHHRQGYSGISSTNLSLRLEIFASGRSGNKEGSAGAAKTSSLCKSKLQSSSS